MNSEINHTNWTICPACHGQSKVPRGPSTKRRREYAEELARYEASDKQAPAPEPLTPNLDVCNDCDGSGLVACEQPMSAQSEKYPHIAIVGGGIGGTALAVACLHRGIPFTLYERDASFDARSQGYGLTLQQASNSMKGFGVHSLAGGITSTRHVVYNSDGKIIGEWGMRKWKTEYSEHATKRKNIHIARQTLRSELLAQLGDHQSIQWGHKLTALSQTDTDQIRLDFRMGDSTATDYADLVVGSDGIRSMVRQLVAGPSVAPLRYLGCIVILGICPLSQLEDIQSPLFDSRTVFQTVNGHERIYVMPYDESTIMWQISFPLTEAAALELSAQGPQAMKAESLRRMQWHSPIPEIINATNATHITGYPVYDRELFDPAILQSVGAITLMGDAAHPMSPFKGQGANQALLDALLLARKISVVCDTNPNWRSEGIRKCILNDFESEMARRSAVKVEGSARAVHLLHSDAVLYEGDEPRGRGIKKED